MSYVTLADLGRRGHHGGGGRRGGGGWYGGYGGYGYPWYDGYPSPIVVMDPVDPQSEESVQKAKEAADKLQIKAIAEAVRAELAKKGLGQYGNYIDVMGPGAREAEVEASGNEVIDEAMPAQQALMYRLQQGLVTPATPLNPSALMGMSDATVPNGVPVQRGFFSDNVVTGMSILAGAALGYAVGAKIYERWSA